MAFRIEPVPGLTTMRVLDGPGDRLAVALVDFLPEGIELFPVERDAPPAPLTGETQRFRTISEVRAFLGITAEARAA